MKKRNPSLSALNVSIITILAYRKFLTPPSKKVFRKRRRRRAKAELFLNLISNQIQKSASLHMTSFPDFRSRTSLPDGHIRKHTSSPLCHTVSSHHPEETAKIATEHGKRCSLERCPLS